MTTNDPRRVMRRVLPQEPEQDQLTLHDLEDYNIGKSILVGNTWYTVRHQDKDKQIFQISIADFESRPKTDAQWVRFSTIVWMVNKKHWGFQLKDETRGKQGWMGKESPRHIGKHDK